ncbi:MAG TPA: M1 family aminopeptidase [Thermoanaerobaculia bacterium]|nr:M1 family aminopeptidase [Thermoanaerobaculia bacterium]
MLRLRWTGPIRALAVLALLLPGLGEPGHADERFTTPDTPPRYMPERVYDLLHLRLDLDFDWEKRAVSGTATHTLVPLRPGTASLVFHAVDLGVTRVRLGVGTNGEPATELPFSLDPAAQTLTVRLDRPRGPGEELKVAIDYTARPRAGLWFVGPDAGYPKKPRQIWSQGEPDLNRNWFPTWDYPNDRATTEMLATVARPFTAVSNGRLAEVIDRPDGRQTFHWIMEQPHTTYLVSVVVSEFARVADQWKGIPIEYYVPPGREEEARVSFGRTPEMMEFFSTATGKPYPFAKYAQTTIYDYMWGGMENITATTQTERTLHPARHDTDFSSEGLVSHELAHQWFGDLITCRSWDHVWLNEGFADYMTALWKEHAHGPDELAWEMDDLVQDHLTETKDKYRRPLVTARYPAPIRMFDAHSYNKGAIVLHMIRGLVGDETWRQGLRAYVERFAGRTVTTADFQEVMEQVSGVPLGPLFDQYVFGAGHPELEVRWEWRPEERLVRLQVEQTQKVTEETGLFSFPVEVALIGEKGTEIRRVQLEPRISQDLAIPSETRPRTVVFDPHGWVLKTVAFDKPIAEWIIQLETADHLAAKLEALRALGQMGGGMSGGEAEAALGRALRQEPHYGTREVAAEALGAVGTEAALEALRPGLEDKHSQVRAKVLEALGKFPGHPELVAVLKRSLEKEESDAARTAAAKALGKFAEQRSQIVPALLRALERPSHRDVVQEGVLLALADLDARETFDQGVRFARWGAPANSRGKALLALANWAGQDARRTEDIRKVLEEYLNDPVYLVRAGVFEALAVLGDPAAIPALERAARNEVDDGLRLRAANAIQQIRDHEAAEAGDLAQRVQQLEREAEVLRSRVEELETLTPGPSPASGRGVHNDTEGVRPTSPPPP